MRKNLLKILSATIITILLSCNGNDKKIEEKAGTDVLTDTIQKINISEQKVNLNTDCSGVGNLVIGKEEAEEMKKNYVDIYMKSATIGKHIAKSVWIDANVIMGFANLLKKDQFDGVRFINAVKDVSAESTLILVPTISTKLQDSSKSSHLNDWTDIALPWPDKIEFLEFNYDKEKTSRREVIFNNLYRNVPETNTYCLSSAVWIDKCVFFALKELIENKANEIDGIRVWLAAYSDRRYEDVLNGSLKADKQSTIILVPTYKFNGNHIDNWDIIKEKTNFDMKLIAAYNHGELCPDKCP